MSKYYSEEQVIQMLNLHVEFDKAYPNADEILMEFTPIELPTDEEIYEKAKTTGGKFVNWTQYESSAFIMGSQWTLDKIKGGGE